MWYNRYIMVGKLSEVKKVQARAILVFGAPCSGKSTFCEKFAARFKAPYFDLGKLVRDYNLDRHMLMIILEQVAKTGQMLVIEGGLDTERDRREVKSVLRKAGYTPTLVWIQTDLGTMKSRLKFREKSIARAKEKLDYGLSTLEAPSELERPVVLSGKHTFETQLRHVLLGLGDN